ncbi:SH3 domain-containing protein [Neobacillus pocheonensis]|uniref:SH3 domain-containing protein n=1 Tax=Neobacillus pocheonensis TaxID=363869 RepID=UPI003D283073
MTKKFSLLLLSFILFFGAFLPQGKSSAASGSIIISSETVNVRGGPGLSYPLVKVANRGEKYSIVKEKDDWIEIQLSFGKTGWVVNWLVTKENEQKTANAASSSESKSTVAIANTDQLRVRSGPGTSFRIVGFLNKGQEVSVLDQNENWYKITSTFGEGWVAKEFLDSRTGQTENKSAATSSKESNTGVVNGDTLNVRKESSSSSTIIGKLTKGTNVTIYTKQNKWYEIGFGNIRGWVSSEFVDIQSGSAEDKPAESSSFIGTVTANSLSIRSGASLNAGIIGSVTKGQSFTILDESNNWAKIEYKTGSFGWVAGWYLDKSTEKPNTGTSSGKETTITILQDGTNIRKQANVQSDVVQRVNEGDTFSVISVKNDWYEIKLKNGKTGFVAGWIVSTNGSAPRIEKSGAEGYLKNKTIVLDPGHGGGDNGTTGANGTLEKELTLRTARLLFDKLTAAGADVYLTRNNDSYVTLPSRVSLAAINRADAFISLHYDSNLDRSVRGMTGYYYHSYQKSLADTIYSSTVGQTNLKNRGVRFGDFHVIRENSQKATLIELGYLSNPEEEMTLKSGAFQENAASGLYDGLARFFKEN